GTRKTVLDDFNGDQYAGERTQNLYFPFSSRMEWKLAYWLLKSSLSLGEIDQYLNLELTKRNHLSFRSAKELKARMDLLPPLARWKSQKLVVNPRYPTKKPVVLFFRDAMEVLQDLLKSPLIDDHISFTPVQIFQTAAKLTRVYESWLSGDRAWKLQ
ncbi:hypothetical protein F5050DRAFT_1538775, partial [Lentinula boryana]